MYPYTTLQKVLYTFTAMLMLCLLTSCFKHYYTTKEPMPSNTSEYVSASKYQNRYFILRSGNDAYHMSNIVVSEDGKLITCQLDTLAANHLLHLHKGRNGKMQYKASLPEVAVLNEVHVYIPDTANILLNAAAYTIPVATIMRVEVVEENKAKTRASAGLGVVKMVAVAVTVVLILVVFNFRLN